MAYLEETVKHLISAVSNVRGLLKMTYLRILIWRSLYVMAPESKNI